MKCAFLEPFFLFPGEIVHQFFCFVLLLSSFLHQAQSSNLNRDSFNFYVTDFLYFKLQLLIFVQFFKILGSDAFVTWYTNLKKCTNVFSFQSLIIMSELFAYIVRSLWVPSFYSVIMSYLSMHTSTYPVMRGFYSLGVSVQHPKTS